MVSKPARPVPTPRQSGAHPSPEHGPGPLGAGPLSSAPLGASSLGSGPLGAGPLSSGPVSSGPVGSGPLSSGPVAHAPTAAAQAAPTVPANLLPNRTPAQLLAIARQGLAEAARTRPDGLRYAAAHLAALRAAAAVLAARARPAAPTKRSRVTSVWSLLSLVSPEFSDWAGYFALGATKRAAAEAGIPRVVSSREADDLLRAAEHFVFLVESALGVAYQPTLEAA